MRFRWSWVGFGAVGLNLLLLAGMVGVEVLEIGQDAPGLEREIVSAWVASQQAYGEAVELERTLHWEVDSLVSNVLVSGLYSREDQIEGIRANALRAKEEELQERRERYAASAERLRSAQQAYRELLQGTVPRSIAADLLALPARVEDQTMYAVGLDIQVPLRDLTGDGVVTVLDFPTYPPWPDPDP